ncbi:MAG: prenyltransferase/squalene oxidase repeat-containing protein [Pirellulaceae bacterium]
MLWVRAMGESVWSHSAVRGCNLIDRRRLDGNLPRWSGISTASTGHETDSSALPAPLEQAIGQILQQLSDQQNEQGFWTGDLAASALSTATAISALCLSLRSEYHQPSGLPRQAMAQWIERGAAWLRQTQRSDGGFGDTDRSVSNIATTLLAIAAFRLIQQTRSGGILPGDPNEDLARTDRALDYVQQQGGWDALRARYGKDKTFVVPILTNCALAGLVDWKKVPSLPFEAAALPQSFYRFVRMPVVSYAIPALVAIGLVKFHHSPPAFWPLRSIRRLCRTPTLAVLRRMQPASGGYLEAVPLTSFVLMSLAEMGQHQHPVAVDAIRFLGDSIRPDGSWPIDTNLATWVTSLAIRGAAGCQRVMDDGSYRPLIGPKSIDWLISCQHLQKHPFTGAQPGGWGWTNLSGAVPDADDTPAALLALHAWWLAEGDSSTAPPQAMQQAVARGLGWLLGLQNRDGGWPTFCRGWGTLPFDRSGSDLTAHALRALLAWQPQRGQPPLVSHGMPKPPSCQRAIERGVQFLMRQQQPDGSWLPLWFGNQSDPREENRVYGTGKVLLALQALQKAPQDWHRQSKLPDRLAEAIDRGCGFLLSAQNADGGWGSAEGTAYGGWLSSRHTMPLGGTECEKSTTRSSIEETAVALEALVDLGSQGLAQEAILKAGEFLCLAVSQGWLEQSSPIGFYFAKLWYYEKLYPHVFSLPALRALATHPSSNRQDTFPLA